VVRLREIVSVDEHFGHGHSLLDSRVEAWVQSLVQSNRLLVGGAQQEFRVGGLARRASASDG